MKRKESRSSNKLTPVTQKANRSLETYFQIHEFSDGANPIKIYCHKFYSFLMMTIVHRF